MPYIKGYDKDRLDGEPIYRVGWHIDTVGDLTYIFSKIANDYARARGLSYGVCANVEAALQNTSKEFYRRVTAPYEDQKIKENGDIFTV